LLKAWLFRKFDGEINQPLLAPIDVAEIEAGRDLADLIANPVREERGLGVVEDDLTDFKELLFAHSSSKYHCTEDYFFNARMLPRNIVVLQ
jgi:hypothetical protein